MGATSDTAWVGRATGAVYDVNPLAELVRDSHFSGEIGIGVELPILRPKLRYLNRFGDVRGFDVFRAGEIGDGAADF